MKQVIGHFQAIDANKRIYKIVVIQETKLNRQKVVVGHQKIFTLGDANGEELICTDDPTVFLKEDGLILRRIGSIKTSDDIPSTFKTVKRAVW